VLVALDSNQFLSDPGLRSQRFRVLHNYLRRTRSQLLLLPPVAVETRAGIRRIFAASARAIDTAIRDGERRGMSSLPAFQADRSVEQSMSDWEARFNSLFPAVLITRPTYDTSILAEAVRRAAERIPPCNDSGGELRDTIIWLSLLSYRAGEGRGQDVAFISQNTSEFAGSDKRSLRPELQEDVRSTEGAFWYYANLEEFNKAHADQVAHIDVEWVLTHTSMPDLEWHVAHFLERVDAERFFSLSGQDAEIYEPNGDASVVNVDLTVTDVFVWRATEQVIELAIHFDAYVEADIDCRLTGYPIRYSRHDEGEVPPQTRTLTGVAEVTGVISAKTDGDAVVPQELEDIENR
jgi:hypothetical protein